MTTTATTQSEKIGIQPIDISILKSFRMGKAKIGALTDKGRSWMHNNLTQVVDGTTTIDLEVLEDVKDIIESDGLTIEERQKMYKYLNIRQIENGWIAEISTDDDFKSVYYPTLKDAADYLVNSVQ